MTADTDPRQPRRRRFAATAGRAGLALAVLAAPALGNAAGAPQESTARPREQPAVADTPVAGEPADRPVVAVPLAHDWLVGGFDRSSRWVTGGLVATLGGMLAFGDTDDIQDLGDLTQLLPRLAAARTAFVITHGIKKVVDKTRSDATADNSVPSGHTSASFTGAAFLWRRYGPKWGAPASVVATFTGISRVIGQKHFSDDVISGMATGLISNWL